MHSSRMHTAWSSSHLLGGVCLSACWDTPRCVPGDPWCGPGDTQVWAWRPPGCWPGDPLVVGLEDPPGQMPELPPRCGPGNHLPWPNPSTSPWEWAWRPAMHAGIPPHPLCEQNHSHVRLRAVMNDYIKTYLSNVKATKFHVEDTSRPHSGK